MNRRPRDRRSPSRGQVDQLASRNSFRYEIQQAVLINNAGFGSYGKLYENSLEANVRQILLNAFSPAILAQLFLPAIVAARDGAIVNVASTAGFQPTPCMAVYGATKAFVLSFSEAFWAENLHRRARPCALSRPGGHGFLQGLRLRGARLCGP
jgi:short-subunit dehydrogenase